LENVRAPGAPGRSVVLLTEVFPPQRGGSAALFGNIYPLLTETAVTVIRNSDDGAVSETTEGPLRMVSLPMTGGHWGVTSLRSLRRYGRLIARVASECRRHPAVVHCGRTLPEGLAALCATRMGGSTQYLCWALGEELQYAKSSRELTFLLRQVLRRASAFVAISRSTATELESLGVPREKVHLVHPGVHAQSFARSPGAGDVRKRHAPGGELLLLTVGRLQRRKGHDLAIRAMAALRHEIQSMKYLIVGDGDERASLEALAVDAGVRDRVIFAGEVPAETLPDYYGAADLFVHPNRIDGVDVEGFGIVFLEAAAAGLSTIGGTTGGSPDAVEAGITGLLVSGTDVAELASAIRTLASSEALRRQMGEAGRIRVVRHFTWERAATQVAEIHRNLSSAA
jgi:phosphatidylinositol alpha-1,6-mannosyltransferase